MKSSMKVLVGAVCMVFVMVTTSHAFLYDVKVLTKDEIAKLSDEALIDKYIDVLVEMEASKTFHQNSGFSMEGYQLFKNLIRFKIWLSLEVDKRGLELGATIPVIEEE